MTNPISQSRLFTIVLREELNLNADEIAKSAKKLVEQSKIYGKEGLTNTQLNHLKNLAFRSEVVQDIVTFIEQQIRKQDGEKGWKKPCVGQSENFGESIKKYLTETMVPTTSDAISDKLQAENVEVDQRELSRKVGIEVARRYISRLVSYAGFKESESKKHEPAEQRAN